MCFIKCARLCFIKVRICKWVAQKRDIKPTVPIPKTLSVLKYCKHVSKPTAFILHTGGRGHRPWSRGRGLLSPLLSSSSAIVPGRYWNKPLTNPFSDLLWTQDPYSSSMAWWLKRFSLGSRESFPWKKYSFTTHILPTRSTKLLLSFLFSDFPR